MLNIPNPLNIRVICLQFVEEEITFCYFIVCPIFTVGGILAERVGGGVGVPAADEDFVGFHGYGYVMYIIVGFTNKIRTIDAQRDY